MRKRGGRRSCGSSWACARDSPGATPRRPRDCGSGARPPTGSGSGRPSRTRRRWWTGGTGTHRRCGSRCGPGWWSTVARRRARRAGRCRRRCASASGSPSASANSIGCAPPWGSATDRPARGENGAPAAGAEAPAWQEGAGGLLLAAAAAETGVVDALAAALPAARRQTTPVPPRPLLRTLLFLGAVGLRRTWDLRGYAGEALALLTGRRRAYGYRHTERFLAEVATRGGAARLTDALAAWTAGLWRPRPRPVEAPLPPYYVDGHHKAVYAEHLIPRGLVARRGVVLGCRALVLLHDARGHPLLVTTH